MVIKSLSKNDVFISDLGSLGYKIKSGITINLLFIFTKEQIYKSLGLKIAIKNKHIKIISGKNLLTKKEIITKNINSVLLEKKSDKINYNIENLRIFKPNELINTSKELKSFPKERKIEQKNISKINKTKHIINIVKYSELNIKQKFYNIVKDVFKPEYTKKINPKYLNFDNQFNRFSKKLSLFNGQKTGLDFGCAHCFSLILGKIIGLDVVGVDIVNSSYTQVQNILVDMGYKIYRFDTFDVNNWSFLKDNRFDFVLAMSSLYKGFSVYNGNSLSVVNNENRKLIVNQLLRIIKKGGIFSISPDNIKKEIRDNYKNLFLKKDIKI